MMLFNTNVKRSLRENGITSLPEEIGDLSSLTHM